MNDKLKMIDAAGERLDATPEAEIKVEEMFREVTEKVTYDEAMLLLPHSSTEILDWVFERSPTPNGLEAFVLQMQEAVEAAYPIWKLGAIGDNKLN